MIADIIRKTTLFCGKNRWVYAVTVIGIGLLFFTTLFLFACASSDLAAFFHTSPYLQTQYVIRTQPCSKADIESVLVQLAKHKQTIQEVSLTGTAEILDESGDQSEITVSTYYPHNESGFYRMSGADSIEKDSNQVLVEYNSGMDSLLSTGYFPSENDQTALQSLSHIRVKNVGDLDVKGFVTSNNLSCLGSVICNYDKYYAIVQSTNAIVIQFRTVLSSKEEQQIIQEVSSLVPIDSITYPEAASQPIMESYKTTLYMYFGIVLICLFGSIQLLVYYLNLRNREFWIYRLLGISHRYHWGHVLATILAILLPGMLIGVAIFTLSGYVLPFLHLFQALNPMNLSCIFAGFFLTSLFLILSAYTIQGAIVRKDTVTEDRI